MAIIVGISVFITAIVLLSVSFDVIDPTQIGVAFDGNTQHIETGKLYDSGRYLIGLGRSFLKFPSVYQTLRFGDLAKKNTGVIVARGSDGMVVTITATMQYKLSQKIEDLVRLYIDYGAPSLSDNAPYNKAYTRIAHSTILDAASQFEAFDFFTRRAEIADYMQAQLDLAFREVYAEVPAFQLVHMSFDSSFSDAIQVTQVAYQDIQQTTYAQKVQQVQADNSVTVAQELSNIILIDANATSSATLLAAYADADALRYRVAQQSQGLLALRSGLHLNSNRELLDYVFLTAIRETTVNDIYIALEYPSLVK